MAEALTALLISSWKCEAHRPVRGGEPGDHQIARKRGVRKILAKYGEWYPPDAWVEGDLDNMERLMKRKGIQVFDTFEYRERDLDGEYSLGKKDVLEKMREFFAQSDKTHFILYFSGHGDRDGSWVFPVTTAYRKKRRERRQSALRNAASPAASSDSSLRSPLSSPPPELAQVQVHGDAPRTQEKRDTPVVVGTEHPYTPPPTPKVPSSDAKDTEMKSISLRERARRQRPAPTKEWNDLIKYEEVMEVWDESKSGESERYLMLILECCHSGRWVQKVDGEVEIGQRDLDEDSVWVEITKKSVERSDVCIQAACGPSEATMVAANQLSSVFTRAFVAAQNRFFFEKLVLTLLDHLFVLNLVSIARSPRGHSFSPVSSKCAPFGGIQFFGSFDDMHLNT